MLYNNSYSMVAVLQVADFFLTHLNNTDQSIILWKKLADVLRKCIKGIHSHFIMMMMMMLLLTRYSLRK